MKMKKRWFAELSNWANVAGAPTLRKPRNGKREMKNPFDMDHATIQEVGLDHQLRQQFIAEHDGDILFGKLSFAISKRTHSLEGIVGKIKSYLGDNARATMPLDRRNVYITGTYLSSPVFLTIFAEEYAEVYKVTVNINAYPKELDELLGHIHYAFEKGHLPVIKWWFMGRHGEEIKEFYMLPSGNKLLPEYYPDLGDPDKFLDDYMKSEETILLIAGPPGTGKTTLLRHMITKYKLAAHVIYDEKIMEKDAPFQTFLFGEPEYSPPAEAETVRDQNAVMIIEDADTILLTRERDGNKLMSRFLNVSDGLIKLPNKKLIFTTNIMDFNNVDQALLRPGRCFGVLHTRLLNLTEAQAAATVAGVPQPTEKREYTLAEIFNQGKRVEVRTVGFGSRH